MVRFREISVELVQNVALYYPRGQWHSKGLREQHSAWGLRAASRRTEEKVVSFPDGILVHRYEILEEIC